MASPKTSKSREAELKYLGFVRSSGGLAVEKAKNLAATAVSLAPTCMTKTASGAYSNVAPHFEPYAVALLSIVSPRYNAVLVSLDEQVGGVISTAQEYYHSGAETANKQFGKVHDLIRDGSQRFEDSAREYFQAMDEGLKHLKDRAREASTSNAIAIVSQKLADLRAMVAKRSEFSRDHTVKHLRQLQASWEYLLSRPEVEKLLDYSSSSLKSLQSQAESVHDAIVADPRYSSLLDTAASWLTWARGTPVGDRVVRLATPYADRVLETRCAGAVKPHAARAVEYWKPRPALEEVKAQ